MEQRKRAVMSARGSSGRGSAGRRPRRKPFSSIEIGSPSTISCCSTIAATGGASRRAVGATEGAPELEQRRGGIGIGCVIFESADATDCLHLVVQHHGPPPELPPDRPTDCLRVGGHRTPSVLDRSATYDQLYGPTISTSTCCATDTSPRVTTSRADHTSAVARLRTYKQHTCATFMDV